MEKIDFSTRLRTIIKERAIRQSELCEKTGIGKSAMSQYMSGAFKPKQQNLFKLAKALDVSEAWLMGYDVPMERISQAKEENNSFYFQATDNSMIEAHIPQGAVVLIERCDTVENGQIIACIVKTSIILRRYLISGQYIVLLPANSSFQPIFLTEKELYQDGIKILGIVKQITINL